jgi:CheY-like chemotaxis protein
MAVTVLIVDDHSSFRVFARRLLESAGFWVVEAPDGPSAIESVAAEDPDLVLLDIQLPGMDGFDVAKRLAERGDGPVVVLTSSRDAADYGDRVAGSPAAGFVPKAEISGPALRSFLTTSR